MEQVDQGADPGAQVLRGLVEDGGRERDVPAASISSASASSWSSAASGARTARVWLGAGVRLQAARRTAAALPAATTTVTWTEFRRTRLAPW